MSKARIPKSYAELSDEQLFQLLALLSEALCKIEQAGNIVYKNKVYCSPYFNKATGALDNLIQDFHFQKEQSCKPS